MARIAAVVPRASFKLLEKQIVEQVRDYLRYRGWRAVRMMRMTMPGSYSTGEPGMPDYLFLYYLKKPHAAALAIWIEFKAPGDRRGCRCANNPKGKRCTVCDQKTWHAREIRDGASVWIVDDFSWFAEQYEHDFGWLHSGATGRGQLDLLAGV